MYRLDEHVGSRSLMHWRIGWCVELMWCLTLTDALTYWLCSTNMLVNIYWLMQWRVGWCVGPTCWLTLSDILTYWLICWVKTLVDFVSFIDILVALYRHVGQHLLTDALTCWTDIFVGVNWCFEVVYNMEV